MNKKHPLFAKLAVPALVFTSSAALSHGSLILNISGTPGSNVVTLTASGSVTMTSAISGISSGLAQAPSGGFWSSGFDNDLGDFLEDGMNTSLNDNLIMTAPISYARNGIQFGSLDSVDFDGASSVGGDDIELDPTSDISYPTLAPGDVLSWTGGGEVTLEDGETFDTLFTGLGTFSNAIDGGFYEVTITDQTIPEPSAVLLSAIGMIGLLRRRR